MTINLNLIVGEKEEIVTKLAELVEKHTEIVVQTKEGKNIITKMWKNENGKLMFDAILNELK